ncbi:MAG: Na/Pi symporter [Thermodesulfobacteriota bacterium]
MTSTVAEHTDRPKEITNTTAQSNWLQWLLIVVLVYFLLVAVSMIGSGFKLAAGDQANQLFAFANNPITALVIGIIATALVQSSSTVTSIVVGLVAGGLPVITAIPIVMGANIGTTITNTIVSLGHIKDSNEFRRAFAAASIHDFFNILSVIIFLPLEIAFGFLDKVGVFLSGFLVGGESMSIRGLNFIKPIVKPPIKFVHETIFGWLPELAVGILMIVLGIVLIILVITFIGKILKTLMVGRAKKILHNAVGHGPVSGITAGALITVLVQSSSTTTSLIVPLAGSGVFSLRQIYPFTLGANIGTTITALLAATAITGTTAIFALQIALVHLVYNLLGVVVIYGVPFLRKLPILAAEKLSDLAVKNKLYVVGYILGIFFILPAILIIVSDALGW